MDSGLSLSSPRVSFRPGADCDNTFFCKSVVVSLIYFIEVTNVIRGVCALLTSMLLFFVSKSSAEESVFFASDFEDGTLDGAYGWHYEPDDLKVAHSDALNSNVMGLNQGVQAKWQLAAPEGGSHCVGFDLNMDQSAWVIQFLDVPKILRLDLKLEQGKHRFDAFYDLEFHTAYVYVDGEHRNDFFTITEWPKYPANAEARSHRLAVTAGGPVEVDNFVWNDARLRSQAYKPCS